MGILQQVKSELNQLPLLLGKLFGGIASVIGCTASIIILTRRLEWPLWPYILMGSAGLIVFIVSDSLLRRPKPSQESDSLSLLSWTILLLVAGLFLFCTYFLTT